MRRKICFCLTLFAVLCAGPVIGQEISERQDIAIFALNYTGAPVSNVVQRTETVTTDRKTGETRVETVETESVQTERIFQQAIGVIDSRIRQVFVDIGRFNVIGIPQRLADADVQSFIDTVRQYNETTAEIPEEVRFGETAFTEADFNRLVGAFYVVIPSVVRYSQTMNEERYYVTSVITSFTILNVETNQTTAVFEVETSGYNRDPNLSMQGAVDMIPSSLDFQLRSIPEFQLRTAIIDIIDNEIYLEFGSDMGVALGEEFRVVRLGERAGYQTEETIALLHVKEVDRLFSVARIVFSEEDVVIGDQVNEIPRMGVSLEPYVDMTVLDFMQTGPALYIGARTAATRGFYGFRPGGGIEVVLGSELLDMLNASVMATLYAGGELNLFLGRLRPHFEFGVGGTVRVNSLSAEDVDFSHIHIHAKGRVAYLFGDSIEIIAEVGAAYHIPMHIPGVSFGGVVAGVSASFR